MISPHSSSRKPQPVHDSTLNLCLAEDTGADMADEQGTKTSFVESQTSGSKVKCGIRARLPLARCLVFLVVEHQTADAVRWANEKIYMNSSL